MAAFSLKIAPKHDTKICYPSIAAVTAEMGGFLFMFGSGENNHSRSIENNQFQSNKNNQSKIRKRSQPSLGM